MRIERGRAAKLRLVVDDAEGVLADPVSPPTVEVLRDDATVVLASGASTKAKTGVYERTLPAQDQLDILEDAWTIADGELARVVRQQVEVVGRRLVTLGQLRKDKELEKVGAEDLELVRTAVEDWFTTALGYPPIPVPARLSLSAVGGTSLWMRGVLFPLEIYSATQGETALTLADLTLGMGRIDWSGGWTPGGAVSLWLRHGLEHPPAHLERAAVIFGRYLARENKLPERAARVSTEGADIIFSIPSPDRPTGLPEVDSVIVKERITAVV